MKFKITEEIELTVEQIKDALKNLNADEVFDALNEAFNEPREIEKEAVWNRIKDDFDPEIEDLVNDKISKTNNCCMPDNINNKKEYEQYLKDIGHNEHIKKLQHHYDTTIGLWATDKPELISDPKKLLFKIT